jgi:hypothetical protein
MNLLNLFKMTLYTTCFGRHWSSSGVLKLFVETPVFAYFGSNVRCVVPTHIRVSVLVFCVQCVLLFWTFTYLCTYSVVLDVSSCCVVCLNHECFLRRIEFANTDTILYLPLVRSVSHEYRNAHIVHLIVYCH